MKELNLIGVNHLPEPPSNFFFPKKKLLFARIKFINDTVIHSPNDKVFCLKCCVYSILNVTMLDNVISSHEELF